MRRARLARVPLLALLGALVVLLALGLMLTGRGNEEAPASSAALDRIAAKNRDAAVVAAARLKADSAAAVAAADARAAGPESNPAQALR